MMPNSMQPPLLSILQISTSEIESPNDADRKLFDVFLHILDRLDDSPSGIDINIINALLTSRDNLLDTTTAEQITLSQWSDWIQACVEYAKKDHLLYKCLAVDTDHLAHQYHCYARANMSPRSKTIAAYPSIKLLQQSFKLIQKCLLLAMENKLKEDKPSITSNDLHSYIDEIITVLTHVQVNANNSTLDNILSDCNALNALSWDSATFHEIANDLPNQLLLIESILPPATSIIDKAIAIKYLLLPPINILHNIILLYSSDNLRQMLNEGEVFPFIKAVFTRHLALFKDIENELDGHNAHFIESLPKAFSPNSTPLYTSSTDQLLSIRQKLKLILTIWQSSKYQSTKPLQSSQRVGSYVFQYSRLLSDAFLLVNDYAINKRDILGALNITQESLGSILGISKGQVSKLLNPDNAPLQNNTQKDMRLLLYYLIQASKQFMEGYCTFPYLGNFITYSDNGLVENPAYAFNVTYRDTGSASRFLTFFEQFLQRKSFIQDEHEKHVTANLIRFIHTLKDDDYLLEHLDNDMIQELLNLISPNSHKTCNVSSPENVLPDSIGTIKTLLFGKNDSITFTKEQFDALAKLLLK